MEGTHIFNLFIPVRNSSLLTVFMKALSFIKLFNGKEEFPFLHILEKLFIQKIKKDVVFRKKALTSRQKVPNSVKYYH